MTAEKINAIKKSELSADGNSTSSVYYNGEKIDLSSSQYRFNPDHTFLYDKETKKFVRFDVLKSLGALALSGIVQPPVAVKDVSGGSGVSPNSDPVKDPDLLPTSDTPFPDIMAAIESDPEMQAEWDKYVAFHASAPEAGIGGWINSKISKRETKFREMYGSVRNSLVDDYNKTARMTQEEMRYMRLQVESLATYELHLAIAEKRMEKAEKKSVLSRKVVPFIGAAAATMAGALSGFAERHYGSNHAIFLGLGAAAGATAGYFSEKNMRQSQQYTEQTAHEYAQAALDVVQQNNYGGLRDNETEVSSAAQSKSQEIMGSNAKRSGIAMLIGAFVAGTAHCLTHDSSLASGGGLAPTETAVADVGGSTTQEASPSATASTQATPIASTQATVEATATTTASPTPEASPTVTPIETPAAAPSDGTSQTDWPNYEVPTSDVHTPPPTTSGAEISGESGSIATTGATPPEVPAVDKGALADLGSAVAEAVAAVKAVTELDPSSFFVIESWNGFTHELIQYAQVNDIHLSVEDSLCLYTDMMDSPLDPNKLLVTPDGQYISAYEMPDGTLGIERPGYAKWSPEAEQFINDWMSERGLSPR